MRLAASLACLAATAALTTSPAFAGGGPNMGAGFEAMADKCPAFKERLSEFQDKLRQYARDTLALHTKDVGKPVPVCDDLSQTLRGMDLIYPYIKLCAGRPEFDEAIATSKLNAADLRAKAEAEKCSLPKLENLE